MLLKRVRRVAFHPMNVTARIWPLDRDPFHSVKRAVNEGPISVPPWPIRSLGATASESDDIELADRLVAGDAVEAEWPQVERLVPSGNDPLCEPSPDGWCLLEPVT
jgi:hypothetical protein